jgi:hypothetical protein
MAEHAAAPPDASSDARDDVAEPDRPAGRGVLAAASISALVVNANTSAVTILLPAISKDLNPPVAQLQVGGDGLFAGRGHGDRDLGRAR